MLSAAPHRISFTRTCQARKIFTLTVGLSVCLMFVIGIALYRYPDKVSLRFVVVNRTNALDARPEFLRSSSLSLSLPSVSTKKQVLLVTYGRSGSSFTSSLIQHHPDVFYGFEPLFSLDLRQKTVAKNDSMAIVHSFLSCKLPVDYIYTVENPQQRLSPDTENFLNCMKMKNSGELHLTCFMEFLRSCEDHDVTFVKTIRFRVAWAKWFLDTNPNFKLLYLIRDPRPTLYSQARTFGKISWNRDLESAAKIHCSRLEEDLAAAELLHKLYPDRVKGIRYENGAVDPYQYTEEMYNFLGLEFNEIVTSYIEELTNHSAEDVRTKQPYSVFRANSTATMNEWRHSASWKGVSIVDGHCGHLYPKLGYKVVLSPDDLVSSRPLFDVPDVKSIFS